MDNIFLLTALLFGLQLGYMKYVCVCEWNSRDRASNYAEDLLSRTNPEIDKKNNSHVTLINSSQESLPPL